MASPPAFGRSMSSHAWKSPPDDGNSLNNSSSIASSSTLLLHPHSSQASNINASQTSARSRTRSIGADGHFITQNRKGAPLIPTKEISRGPGTPDITLDAFEEIRGRKDSPVSIKSRLAQTDTDVKDLTRKRSSSGEQEVKCDKVEMLNLMSPSSDAARIVTPTRPRLTNQLRSFISSFKTSSVAHTPTEEKEEEAFISKARSSYESENEERNSWQNCQVTGSRPGPSRPKALVMPAARAAGPEGMSGLNDDSPPLTPISDEAKDSDSVDIVRELTHASSLRHPWSAAQARADGSGSGPSSLICAMDRDCMTPTSSSTIASGRSSPLLTSLSVGSSVGTYVPSRPNSSMAMFKFSTSPFFGLLPSHTISPSGSPSPPEHATKAYWHATTTSSIFSNLLSRLSLSLSSTRLPPLRRHLPALVFLMTAFIGSTICILLALSTLPLHLPSHITNLTIAEIRDMSIHLQTYSRSSPKAFIHTLSVLAAFYTWKQSFTIPGSLIMNVVFGAMYGTWMGTLYTSVLTSLGGVFCYLLMAPLGSLIRTLPGLHTVLEKMQKAMHSSSSGVLSRHSAPLTVREQQTRRQSTKQKNGNVWTYLLILRVLPIVPYGLMNIACSVLRVPLVPYAVTLAVGSIPWNACTVQVGDLLVQVVSALDEANLSFIGNPNLHGTMLGQEVNSKAQSGARAIAAKVWNKEMMLKLILMSLVSLAPLLLQRYLKKEEVDAEHIGLLEQEDEQQVMEELDQEASVAMPSDDDDDVSVKQSQWRFSWSSPTPANVAAATTTTNGAIATFGSKESPPPTLNSSPSKRFSGVWTMNAEERMMAANRIGSTAEDLEGSQPRKYPSLKRAVTTIRVS